MADLYGKSEDSKFGVILSKTMILLLAVFTLYLLLLNVVFAFKNNVALYALPIIPGFIIIFLAAYKLKMKPWIFALVIFISAFVLKGLPAVLIETQPVSDFNTYYQCAIKLLNGDKSFGHSFYFGTWAYQTGPVIYYAAIMKVFGTGLLPLQLVNCFFMAGSNAFIYLIAKKISNDRAARFIALLYLLYPAPYFLASVLTNQHFAACMFLLAIYILINERLNFFVRVAASGIIMSFGNAVRPLGIVIAGAAIIWGIIETIRSKKALPAVTAAVLVAIYLITNFAFSAAVRHSDINPEGLKNNFPLWKFVIGVNHNSKGLFSYEDEKNIFYIEDPAKRDMAAKQVIRERLEAGPRELAELVNAKQTIMWAGFDTLRWSFSRQVDGKLILSEKVKKYESVILKTEKMYYILIFLLMLAGLCKVLKSNNIISGVTLISTILLCYFGAHILIEIQVRYRYFAVMLVFILASKGAELVFSRRGIYNRRIYN